MSENPSVTPAPPSAAAPVRIEVRDLSKRYGEHRAVEGLSFTCEPGTVTGFLGPNGAGKSTTLRILTGLAEPSGGQALIDGVRYRDLPAPGRRIGVMLDARALHSGRTGLETLRLAAIAAGMPRGRADEVLALVGLEGAGRKRVGGYSYGMRQRLGIGVALIGDPAALVLDEPANGLDPDGIRWMRRLLRSFADAGGTVLLSSHQLSEVQATADRVLVIAGGRLVREGALAEVTAGGGTRVAATDPVRLRQAIDAVGAACTPHGDGALDVALDAADVGRLALHHQLVLTALHPVEDGSLEDVFFTLTDGARGDAGSPVGAPAAPSLLEV
ncbi:ATP-binding cassette domain-containing protein [Brachybacterium sp. JHP9]|uniref:ATP-binding cassette domain-containing protein n=1 Tax=Brachybacterium equifaecis TaxID=2910770 RepID=A0ABT0QXI5_9MICO|nr:ATP-binding cassette domain-containing protein [Brachybacterium equifaecis]MCL6422321.1 ATP-binding cassette domain-containing protein [Brachybacterium equifaecis]